MPTIFTHAIAAGSVGVACLPPDRTRLRLVAAAAVCAALPDVDVLAFRLGIPYSHMFGHRGITHSLLFAVVLATAVTLLLRQTMEERQLTWRLWALLVFATMSHGVLDG